MAKKRVWTGTMAYRGNELQKLRITVPPARRIEEDSFRVKAKGQIKLDVQDCFAASVEKGVLRTGEERCKKLTPKAREMYMPFFNRLNLPFLLLWILYTLGSRKGWMEHFSESAPREKLMRELGFSVEWKNHTYLYRIDRERLDMELNGNRERSLFNAPGRYFNIIVGKDPIKEMVKKNIRKELKTLGWEEG